MTTLIDAIKNNTYESNKLKIEDDNCDIKELCEALKVNSSITSLDLGNSDLEEEEMIYISEVLKTNSFITSLYLYYNNITDEGIIYLVKYC